MTLKLVPEGGKREIRIKGQNITPGHLNRPDATAAAFDEEGFYRTGDAVVFVDEADPNQGLMFDGRIAEDFKLSTGTWVSVATVRGALVSAARVLSDAVIAGHDRDEVTALAWLHPSEAADCGVTMAQQVNVSFVDDLDGSEAEGTVVFGVDGKQYEIDLSGSNAAKLRGLLTPFVDAGRKLGGGARVPRMSSATRTSRDDAKIIREWAGTQVLVVSARGRISAEVVEACQARDEKQAAAPGAEAATVEEAATAKKTRSRAKAKQPMFSDAV